MAKLQNIDLPNVADKKAKNGIPKVSIPGDAVTRFNLARDLVDRGQATMNELKPELQKAGLEAVFAYNSVHANDPTKLISSVNLVGQLPEGDTATPDVPEMVQFTWTKKNLASDSTQVEAEFNRILTTAGKKPNINNYYGFEIAATFDTAVFMVGGKFNEDRYKAFMEALKAVSETFEVPNPLSCAKNWTAKPDFHERRWTQFDLETNLELQTVLPTQLNLKPIRPAA